MLPTFRDNLSNLERSGSTNTGLLDLLELLELEDGKVTLSRNVSDRLPTQGA